MTRRRFWRPALVLTVTLSMTAVVALLSIRALERAEQLRFERAAASEQRSLKERIETHVDTLRATSGLFSATDLVARNAFRRFFERLDLQHRYPGIRSLGWIEHVEPDTAAPNDATRQADPDGNASFPIAYLEPSSPAGAAAIGLDMWAVGACRPAMERARDTGDAAATSKLDPALGLPFDRGFLIFVPVYRAQDVPLTQQQRRDTVRGFVFAHIELEPIFDVGSELPLAIAIYDGQKPAAESLLFRTNTRPGPVSPTLVTTRLVEAPGRSWVMRLHATPDFKREPYVLMLLLVFVGGGLISLLLAGITWSESAARAGAEAAAAGLEQSRDVLLQADQAKNRFLTVLGHELRNPLGAVSNALLVMRQRGLGSPQAERALQIAERQVAHQTRLVDDLLDISRISTGKIELQRRPVNLLTVVERVIQGVRWLADEQHQELSLAPFPQSVTVNGDPERLEQVVWNLISNAIKYTPPGGRVQVEVTREVRTGISDRARLTVHDSGIGLTAEERDQIFNLFAQAAPATRRAPGGLGIGLTLVEQIVTLHGGTVDVRSDGHDCGSEFVVRLPLSDDASPCAANAEPHPNPPTSQRRFERVLIIEDNADARDMLAELLSGLGLDVETAADGEHGVQAALTHTPAVVLVDLELPGINGFEVARQIRESAGAQPPLLVALTGYGQPQERERAAQVGFDEYVLKPLDLERLLSILEEHAARNGH